MIPYNLIYLKYFCDAVKTEGISSAAKKNFVSQSAVSQGIRKLEESLGRKLIHHRPNRFQLTHEGKLLYAESGKIFQSVRRVEEKLGEAEGQITGTLSFACSHSLALALVSGRLNTMQQMHPDLNYDLRIAHPNIVKTWVKNGELDFGIALDSEDLSKFDCQPLYHGSYRFYTNPKKWKSDEKRFLLSENRDETKQTEKAYLKKFKKPMPVLMNVPSWELIAEMTVEGMGIGYIPDYITLRKKELTEYDSGLSLVNYTVFAFSQAGLELPKSAKELIQLF